MTDLLGSLTLDLTAPASRRSLVCLPQETVAPELVLATAGLELQELIGEGGLGVVHAAHHALLDRTVAVKHLRKGASMAGRLALLREARIMGSLEHPNIIPVHGLGVDDAGLPVLVMKRVLGSTWAEHFGELELERHIEILRIVAETVQFAHQHGIVHRDLKPENILIGSGGEVYIADWGASLRVGEQAGPGGTPWYMAPEMFAPAVGDARMDIYCLGAVLHQVLTGKPRNPGKTLREAKCAATRPFLPSGLHSELERWVVVTTQLQPNQRCDLDELVTGLSHWLEDRPLQPLLHEATLRLQSMRDAEAEGDPIPVLVRTEGLFGLRTLARQRPEAHQAPLIEALELCVRDACRRDQSLEDCSRWMDEIVGLGGHDTPLRPGLKASRSRQRRRTALAYENNPQINVRRRNAIGLAWMISFFACAIGLVLLGYHPDNHIQCRRFRLIAGSWLQVVLSVSSEGDGLAGQFETTTTARVRAGASKTQSTWAGGAVGAVLFGTAYLLTLLAALTIGGRIFRANTVNRGVRWAFGFLALAMLINRTQGWYAHRTMSDIYSADLLLAAMGSVGLAVSTGTPTRIFGLCCLAIYPLTLASTGTTAAVVFHSSTLVMTALFAYRMLYAKVLAERDLRT